MVMCYCNGGHQDTHRIGIVPEIGEVHFNPKLLANITSLSEIDDKYRIIYNSHKEKAFIVHNTSTGDKKIVRSKGGLHYYDIGSQRNKRFSLLQTAQDNKQEFTKKEITKADKSRDLYVAIGRPGYQFFSICCKGSLS